MPSSRGSSQPRNQTQVSHTAGRFFTIWVNREALYHFLLYMETVSFYNLNIQTVILLRPSFDLKYLEWECRKQFAMQFCLIAIKDQAQNLVVAVVAQLLSCVRLFVGPWTAARQASLSFTVSQSFLKLLSIKSVILCNHLILYHPLLLLPSIFPSSRLFPNKSAVHIRWPKYWSLSFSISPSNEYSGLISLRIDWLDLLAVQGTLKILLQYHSSKTSILWRSAFFMVHLSHPYMTTRKLLQDFKIHY